MTPGAELIAAERVRQVVVEGYTFDRDDLHTHGELARAAMAYTLLPPEIDGGGYYGRAHLTPLAFWPWWRGSFSPTGDRVRDLVKAGALIAAEIDRLQRAALPVGE